MAFAAATRAESVRPFLATSTSVSSASSVYVFASSDRRSVWAGEDLLIQPAGRPAPSRNPPRLVVYLIAICSLIIKYFGGKSELISLRYVLNSLKTMVYKLICPPPGGPYIKAPLLAGVLLRGACKGVELPASNQPQLGGGVSVS